MKTEKIENGMVCFSGDLATILAEFTCCVKNIKTMLIEEGLDEEEADKLIKRCGELAYRKDVEGKAEVQYGRN